MKGLTYCVGCLQVAVWQATRLEAIVTWHNLNMKSVQEGPLSFLDRLLEEDGVDVLTLCTLYTVHRMCGFRRRDIVICILVSGAWLRTVER